MSVTENGFGKRTPVEDYRMTNRGGQGVANIECSTRNGPVVASYVASEDDQIMLVTNSGKLIRTSKNVYEISINLKDFLKIVTFYNYANENQLKKYVATKSHLQSPYVI